jgi:DNA-binding transcriptional regulator YiaG
MLPDEETLKSKKHPAADRPYPRECRKCGQVSVVPQRIDYQDTVRFDDRMVSFLAHDIEIPICRNCGEKVFTEQVDSQLCEALQRHLHLLTPAEIREGINKLGLSHKEVAERLGIAEDLLWRWAHGFSVQPRAMDNLLRLFLQVPEVRTVLSVPALESTLGFALPSNAVS